MNTEIKNKPFVVYQLTRQEYTTESFYRGKDATGEDIIETVYNYSGKESRFLGKDKKELIHFNNIPQWKAKITGEFVAIKGHSDKGYKKYLFDCTPITIIS